jgi:serine phosphatase RsbU (regulator of sigma subunit)
MTPPRPPERPGPLRSSRLAIRPLTALVLVIGIGLTTVLTFVVRANTNSNENRLLGLQAGEVATTLRISVPTIEDRLVAAYDDAESAGFSTAVFRTAMEQDIGTNGFVSASLWDLRLVPPRPLVEVGTTAAIGSSPQKLDFFAKLVPSPTMYLTKVLPGPRLGYAIEPPGDTESMVVYAETELPHNQSILPQGGALEGLNYALFLGRTMDRVALLESSTSLPLRGATASANVPFGDSSITVVVSPTHPLEGTLAQDLPLIVGLAAGILTLLAAVIAEALLRGRDLARLVAQRTERSLEEQRSIAASLQQAMLPEELPVLHGAAIAVTYLPGQGDMEIGGDWYDVIPIDQTHFYMVVGDVSGRGLSAARTMAELRYAIRAFLAQGDSPEVAIGKLGKLVEMGQHGQFATAIIGRVDVARHSISIVNAGHMPLLLMSKQRAEFVRVPVNPPIGVPGPREPVATTIQVPRNAMVIAFTDGLVERRAEAIDAGLERLRVTASSMRGPVRAMLPALVSRLAPEGAEDDIAVLGIQWLS